MKFAYIEQNDDSIPATDGDIREAIDRAIRPLGWKLKATMGPKQVVNFLHSVEDITNEATERLGIWILTAYGEDIAIITERSSDLARERAQMDLPREEGLDWRDATVTTCHLLGWCKRDQMTPRVVSYTGARNDD